MGGLTVSPVNTWGAFRLGGGGSARGDADSKGLKRLQICPLLRARCPRLPSEDAWLVHLPVCPWCGIPAPGIP